MSGELLPIRCVTCGKVLADKWDRYMAMLESGESIEKALNRLGLNRPCCRIRLMNPFKYAEQVDSNGDNLYTAKNKNVSTEAALSSIANDTPVRVPSNEEIELPPLPDLPPPKQAKKKPTRVYSAV